MTGNQEKIYIAFETWLDNKLSKKLKDDIVAFNFNLYECVGIENDNKTYGIELVGCNTFDEHDEDWTCDDVWSTRDGRWLSFYIQRTKDIEDWQQGLVFITALCKKYLNEGKYAHKIKASKAVGVGFVGGNIEIIHLACEY